jgi:membrane-bound metal-dependent hydrolase YbcI (DUF457 family)
MAAGEGALMAEYVRRKRPPANHPYWARLHERAHPPSVVTPVVVLGGIGMFLGLYGGLMEPMPYAKAVKTAATVAAGAAGVLFVTSVPVLLFDASRHMPRHERWPAALLSGLAAAVVLFFTLLIPLVLLLLWYSTCSGRGPWLGTLTGLGIGAVPGMTYAAFTRWLWRKRQRQWPRWERMRAPRRRDRALTVTPIPLPIEPPASAEPPAEPREGRRAAE